MTEERPIFDIPIFHKTYELYKLLSSYQDLIPKKHRYTLWQKCENTALSLLEGVIATSHSKGAERTPVLQHISRILDLLKVLIRLAHDTGALRHAHYLAIQSLLQEIGKMIGGWLKFAPHSASL